jgi:hypothetical protein
MFWIDENPRDAPAVSPGTLIGALVGAAVGLGVTLALGLPGIAETTGLAPALAIGSFGMLAGGYTGAVMGTRSAPESSPADEQPAEPALYPLVGLELEPDTPDESRHFRDRVAKPNQTAGTAVTRRR